MTNPSNDQPFADIAGDYSTLKELYDRLIAVAKYKPSMMFQVITGVIANRRCPIAYKKSHEFEYCVSSKNGEMKVESLAVWKTNDTHRKRKPYQYTLTDEEQTVCADLFKRLMGEEQLVEC
jgi:hypothetical protein